MCKGFSFQDLDLGDQDVDETEQFLVRQFDSRSNERKVSQRKFLWILEIFACPVLLVDYFPPFFVNLAKSRNQPDFVVNFLKIFQLCLEEVEFTYLYKKLTVWN